MGHAYMIILVMLCQTLVYREVTRLFMLTDIKAKATDETRERDVWSKTLSWYFFAVANYFLYGESIIYYFKVRSDTPETNDILKLMHPKACCLLRCSAHDLRHQSPYHQFRTVHHRLRWICYVAQTWIPEAAIRLVLLGTHDLALDRRVQVYSSHLLFSGT